MANGGPTTIEKLFQQLNGFKSDDKENEANEVFEFDLDKDAKVLKTMRGIRKQTYVFENDEASTPLRNSQKNANIN